MPQNSLQVCRTACVFPEEDQRLYLTFCHPFHFWKADTMLEKHLIVRTAIPEQKSRNRFITVERRSGSGGLMMMMVFFIWKPNRLGVPSYRESHVSGKGVPKRFGFHM